MCSALWASHTSRAWRPLSSRCPGPIGPTKEGVQQSWLQGLTSSAHGVRLERPAKAWERHWCPQEQRHLMLVRTHDRGCELPGCCLTVTPILPLQEPLH